MSEYPRILINPKPEEIIKPFLSHSTWKQYVTCPVSFYFKYILKLDYRRHAGMAIGSSWDTTLNYIANSILSGQTFTTSLVQEKWEESYQIELEDAVIPIKKCFTPKELQGLNLKYGYKLPKKVVKAGEEKYRNYWREWGAIKAKEYCKEVVPNLYPKRTQLTFYIDFNEKTPFMFKGTIDRVDEDNSVVDNKTSAARWDTNSLAFDLQCIGYSLAHKMIEGKPPKRILYDILVKTKTQTFREQFQRLELRPNDNKIHLLVESLGYAFLDIRNGVFSRKIDNFAGKGCVQCSYADKCWNPLPENSRPPTQSEMDAYITKFKPSKKDLEGWTEKEHAKPRIKRISDIRSEVKRLMSIDPKIINAYY